MQYLVELHQIVDANNHHGLFYSVVTSLSWHSEHLERSLSLESLLQTIALIISWIGDKVFKHTKFSKGTEGAQLFLYRNHCRSGITKP